MPTLPSDARHGAGNGLRTALLNAPTDAHAPVGLDGVDAEVLAVGVVVLLTLVLICKQRQGAAR